MGGAVDKSFVVTGIVVSGSDDVGIVEDGGVLMGFADSDDAGVGGSLVTVGVEIPVGDSGLLVEVADESVVGTGRLLVDAGGVICGVDWVTGSWVACGAVVVGACWLHPYSDKLTSVLAAVIWIFRNDFIFVIPFLLAGIYR
jgi:hypothetical protein